MMLSVSHSVGEDRISLSTHLSIRFGIHVVRVAGVISEARAVEMGARHEEMVAKEAGMVVEQVLTIRENQVIKFI